MRGPSRNWGSAPPAAAFLLLSLCLFDIGLCSTVANAPKTPADTPEIEIEWPGRIVAVGDLHGDAGNALLLLDAAGVVDKETRKWKGGNTLLIQTGDIIDRGPDGKILYDLLDEWKRQAREAGGKVVHLLGNHDAMNICGDFRYVHPKETAQFGGLAKRRAAFSEGGKYGAMLLSLPAAVKVNGMLFSHAGLSPSFAELGLLGTEQLLKEELRDGCTLHYEKSRGTGHSLFASGEDGPLWTRLYTLSPPHIGCPALKKALSLLESDVMVVGHTVQESLNIETHCGGMLVAIDTGISRFVANSPRGIEVTHDGTIYEVAVHPYGKGESTDDKKSSQAET